MVCGICWPAYELTVSEAFIPSIPVHHSFGLLLTVTLENALRCLLIIVVFLYHYPMCPSNTYHCCTLTKNYGRALWREGRALTLISTVQYPTQWYIVGS